MRAAEGQTVWTSLRKSFADSEPRLLSIGDSSIDLSAGCTVISGRNGTGKSRLLRDIERSLNERALRLDMHYLCEQALMILRSRSDLDEMIEEFDVLGPDESQSDDISQIIGRRYDLVEWYALEIQPPDETVATRFLWSRDSSDVPLVPYFRVEYRNLIYTAKDMGLGEFSIHFLFWILNQFRDVKNLTLLLDEPDAYLPPVGVERLLIRLMNICLKRRWRLIISTHSEEMISRAIKEDALIVLRMDSRGRTTALSSKDRPDVAAELLSRPPIDQVLFCEDESAWYLIKALLEAHDPRASRSTSVIWGHGHGYLRKLQEYLPRAPQSELKFAFVFDGDQRGTTKSRTDQWPAVFLPTANDPDSLFQEVARDPTKLANRLGLDLESLQFTLDSIEADDPHDWVTSLGDRFSRPTVLRALATLWVESHADEAGAFVANIKDGWSDAQGPTSYALLTTSEPDVRDLNINPGLAPNTQALKPFWEKLKFRRRPG